MERRILFTFVPEDDTAMLAVIRSNLGQGMDDFRRRIIARLKFWPFKPVTPRITDVATHNRTVMLIEVDNDGCAQQISV